MIIALLLVKTFRRGGVLLFIELVAFETWIIRKNCGSFEFSGYREINTALSAADIIMLYINCCFFVSVHICLTDY